MASRTGMPLPWRFRVAPLSLTSSRRPVPASRNSTILNADSPLNATTTSYRTLSLGLRNCGISASRSSNKTSNDSTSPSCKFISKIIAVIFFCNLSFSDLIFFFINGYFLEKLKFASVEGEEVGGRERKEREGE